MIKKGKKKNSKVNKLSRPLTLACLVGLSALLFSIARPKRIALPDIPTELLERSFERLSGDIDCDGLATSQEVNLNGTDPLKIDTDGDGIGDFYDPEPLKPNGLQVKFTVLQSLLSDGSEIASQNDRARVRARRRRRARRRGGRRKIKRRQLRQAVTRLLEDTDGDQLPNYLELLKGTDPLSADSDGDGSSDGDEVFVLNTCPNAVDSDSDGVTDRREQEDGLDPLNPDTDGDGGSDGDEVRCGTDPLSASDQDGDGLADDFETIFATNSCFESCQNISDQDGPFLNALTADSDQSGTNDGQEDLDQDGLTNIEESQRSLNPCLSDTDGDSLSDGDEVNTFGTDPTNADTDGDGFTDGEEIAAESSPLDPTDFPSDDEPNIPDEPDAPITPEEPGDEDPQDEDPQDEEPEEELPEDEIPQDDTPVDNCPDNEAKLEPGVCGCEELDLDTDGDGTFDCNDNCSDDANKTQPGECGCGTPDQDSDEDGALDCNDLCPTDSTKTEPLVCGCGNSELDSDLDGTPDCRDGCSADANKTEPGVCGCGVADTDTDGDGVPDCNDRCTNDPNKSEPLVCGCGVADTDTDGDGTLDCNDQCSNDPNKTEPLVCGCGAAETDSDSDGVPDCNDKCSSDPNKTEPLVCGCGVADADTDGDGTLDCNDQCSSDPNKSEPLVCGCGTAETDSDGDGVPDCNDQCSSDPNKSEPLVCGCGTAETDSDGDGILDCNDKCPNDAAKSAPGACGCGTADTDSDGDGVPNCRDQCPNDPIKQQPGICGCGSGDIDTDGDGVSDCNDQCINDPAKQDPGVCGCGAQDVDSDGDGTLDCRDSCPTDGNKTSAGVCGCGTTDLDSDGDGVFDCQDDCPADSNKTSAGVCGCGTPDLDSDGDGALDCRDDCPADGDKTSAGICGCGAPDLDRDLDGAFDCRDDCPADPNKTAPGDCGCGSLDIDSDLDGTADCRDNCSEDPNKLEPGICGCGVVENTTDSDGDSIIDCLDNCPNISNSDQANFDEDSLGDVCDDDDDNDTILDDDDTAPFDPENDDGVESAEEQQSPFEETPVIVFDNVESVSTPAIAALNGSEEEAGAVTRRLKVGAQLNLVTDLNCVKKRREQGDLGRFYDKYIKIPDNFVEESRVNDEVMTIDLKTPMDLDVAQDEIRKDPCVSGLSENTLIDNTDPSPDQAESSSTGSRDYLRLIRFPESKNYFRSELNGLGRKLAVAVIDTGYDLENSVETPDLSRNLEGSNIVGSLVADENEQRDVPQDREGHGTEVTNVLMANDTNSDSYQGVASISSELIPIRLLSDREEDNDIEIIINGQKAPDRRRLITPVTMFRAIKHAVNAGADVVMITSSFLGRVCDPIIGHAIYRGIEKGTFFVFSAGNGVKFDANEKRVPGPVDAPSSFSALRFRPTATPACWGGFKGALSVASLSDLDTLDAFSNFGDAVEIAAPGVNIETRSLNNAQIGRRGTSYAAPQVAGAVSLMMAVHKRRGWHRSPFHLEDVFFNAFPSNENLKDRFRGGRVLDLKRLADYLEELSTKTEDERLRIPSDNPSVGAGLNPLVDLEDIEQIFATGDKQEYRPGDTFRPSVFAVTKDGKFTEIKEDLFFTSQYDDLFPIDPLTGEATLASASALAGRDLEQGIRVLAHYWGHTGTVIVNVADPEDSLEGFELRRLSLGGLSAGDDGVLEIDWGLNAKKLSVTAHYVKVDEDGNVIQQTRDVSLNATIRTGTPEEFKLLDGVKWLVNTASALGGQTYGLSLSFEGLQEVLDVRVKKQSLRNFTISSPLGNNLHIGRTGTFLAFFEIDGRLDPLPTAADWRTVSCGADLRQSNSGVFVVDTTSLGLGSCTIEAKAIFTGDGDRREVIANYTLDVTDEISFLSLVAKPAVLSPARTFSILNFKVSFPGTQTEIIDSSEIEWSSSNAERLPVTEDGVVIASLQSLPDGVNSAVYRVTGKWQGHEASTNIKVLRFNELTGASSDIVNLTLKTGSFGPQETLSRIGWGFLHATGVFLEVEYGDGLIRTVGDRNASFSVDDKRVRYNSGRLTIPYNVLPNFSARVTGLYEGFKATNKVDAVPSPLENLDMQVVTLQSTTSGTRRGSVRQNANGEYEVKQDYFAEQPYRVYLETRPTILNGTRNRLETPSSGCFFVDTVWTLDIPGVEPVFSNNCGFSFDPFPLNGKTVTVTFQAKYLGSGEVENITKTTVFKIDFEEIVPQPIDFFLRGFNENRQELNYFSRTLGITGIEVLSNGNREFVRDIPETFDFEVFEVESGKAVDFNFNLNTSKDRQGNPYHNANFYILSEDATNKDLILRVFHNGLNLSKSYPLFIREINDYIYERAPERIPSRDDLTTVERSNFCDDPNHLNPEGLAAGIGTSTDPFKVCTIEQLINVEEVIKQANRERSYTEFLPPECNGRVNNQNPTCGFPHVHLEDHLDFESRGNLNRPIRLFGPRYFNGNNYEIRNASVVDGERGNLGIFGTIGRMYLKNLRIVNPTIRGERTVGGLGANVEDSHLENVHVIGGNIIGQREVGGFFGGGRNVVFKGCSVIDTLIEVEKTTAGGFIGKPSQALLIADSLSAPVLRALGVQGGHQNFGGFAGDVKQVGSNIRRLFVNGIGDFIDPASPDKFEVLANSNTHHSIIANSSFEGSIEVGNNRRGRSNVGGVIGLGGMSVVGVDVSGVIEATGSHVGGLFGDSFAFLAAYNKFSGQIRAGRNKEGAGNVGGLWGYTNRLPRLMIGNEVTGEVAGFSTVGPIAGDGGHLNYLSQVYNNSATAKVTSGDLIVGGFFGRIVRNDNDIIFHDGSSFRFPLRVRGNTWSVTGTPDLSDVGLLNSNEPDADLEGVDEVE